MNWCETGENVPDSPSSAMSEIENRSIPKTIVTALEALSSKDRSQDQSEVTVTFSVGNDTWKTTLDELSQILKSFRVQEDQSEWTLIGEQ